MDRPANAACEVVLVHSSDLHVDEDRNLAMGGGDGTAGLSSAVLDRAGQLLADAVLQVVLLPGNHDPALADSVFVRGGLAELPNVSILGMTHDEAVPFPAYDLEIWRHAHRDYFSMAPLRGPR